MKIYTLIFDKKFDLQAESGFLNENLIQKVADKLEEGKLEGKLRYKGDHLYWHVVKHKSNYVVSVVDVTEFIQYKREAMLDQLTGLYTRHAYWRLLGNEVDEAVRLKHLLGVVFIDIDNLKSINAERGYLGGDFVIQGIAHLVLKVIRKYDNAVRLGGDEFLVLINLKDEHRTLFEKTVIRIYKKIHEKAKEFSSATVVGTVLEPSVLEKLHKARNLKEEWEKVIESLDNQVISAKRSGKDNYRIIP